MQVSEPTSHVRVLESREEAVEASVAARDDFLFRVKDDVNFVRLTRDWWPLAPINPPVVDS